MKAASCRLSGPIMRGSPSQCRASRSVMTYKFPVHRAVMSMSSSMSRLPISSKNTDLGVFKSPAMMMLGSLDWPCDEARAARDCARCRATWSMMFVAHRALTMAVVRRVPPRSRVRPPAVDRVARHRDDGGARRRRQVRLEYVFTFLHRTRCCLLLSAAVRAAGRPLPPPRMLPATRYRPRYAA